MASDASIAFLPGFEDEIEKEMQLNGYTPGQPFDARWSRLAKELVAILDLPTRFDAARYNENDLRREGLAYCAVDGTALLFTVLDSPAGAGRTIMILACGATNDGHPRLATIIEAQERLKRHQSTRSRS